MKTVLCVLIGVLCAAGTSLANAQMPTPTLVPSMLDKIEEGLIGTPRSTDQRPWVIRSSTGVADIAAYLGKLKDYQRVDAKITCFGNPFGPLCIVFHRP